jgi:hypothetical protein
VAKPDRIELHDVGETGIALKGSLDMWGSVVAIEHVQLKVRAVLSTVLSPGCHRI